MSDKIKKETTLFGLKVIHLALTIFIMLFAFGVQYWPKGTEVAPPPTLEEAQSKEQNTSTFNLNDNHGNQQVGNNNTFNHNDNSVTNNDNRVTNNYNLTPKGSNQPRKSPSSETIPPKKKIATNYFNKNFSGDIAIVGLNGKNDFSNELKTFLKNGNYQTTTSFFRSSFLQDYEIDIWEQGNDIFENFQIHNNINCACLLKENVKYREMDRSGSNMIAEGSIDLKIINVNSGESTNFSIVTGGSGYDKPNAYIDMQANFLKELTLQNQLSNFELCKK